MFFTIPNLFERMIDEPVSVIGVLSLTAMITTISLFFCGIPICLEIWNRGKTDDISGFPFLMGFLGGAFWLRYGLLKADLTMLIVNTVGVSMMLLYLIFYVYYTESRKMIIFELLVVTIFIAVMLLMVDIYGERVHDPLGFVCMTFNIINFGAPLAGIAVVFRKKSCDTLPLPLCSANLLVSSQWFLYGILQQDKYIIIPNGAGIILAFLQISLFLVFPRNENSRAPLSICFPCLNNLKNNKDDSPINIASGMRNGFIVNEGFNWPLERRVAIPSSKNACIEFLRSTAFNSGGYYVFPYSTSSRVTEESTSNMTNGSHLGGGLSISHPELWQPTEDAMAVFPAQNCHTNEAFNYSYSGNFMNNSRNSGTLFNCSRSSGIVNPLALSYASYACQNPHLFFTDTNTSDRRPVQQLQQTQTKSYQKQQKEEQRRPSQEEHLLCPSQYEFERVCELHELERQWRKLELKRTISAPNLLN